MITTVLSNIFTMRLIGNKTHGDLAEIGICEFINQFMYDFSSRHVGKELYRAKECEEDIIIVNELSKATFPLSLKAYGDGPLQLSTDKKWKMYSLLDGFGSADIHDKKTISAILSSEAFEEFANINVMSLIYDERKKRCNILIFDYEKARRSITKIKKVSETRGRLHPLFLFLDAEENYICEVRYGGATANALQRGLWTHTRRALAYFDSLTNGWVDYSHNHTLVRLFSLALVASEQGHAEANGTLQQDIERLKRI